MSSAEAFHGSAGLFIPLSDLKALRRAAANRCLEALRHPPSSQGLAEDTVLPGMLKSLASSNVSKEASLCSSSSSSNASGSSNGSAGAQRRVAVPAGAPRPVALHGSACLPDSSSSRDSAGKRPQRHAQQQQRKHGQLRLLCRTMAQVRPA